MEFIYNGNEKESGIYKIVCIKNNKHYFGETVCFKRRWEKEHEKQLKAGKHTNKPLQNAYNLYGSDAFVCEIVEIIYGSKLERTQRETEYIAEYTTSTGQRPYNTVLNTVKTNIGPYSHTPDETKLIQSAVSKKKWDNPGYREKASEAMKKRWQNSEYRERLREAHLGISPPNKGKGGYKTVPCPEEKKKRLSESNKGKHCVSEQTREKLIRNHKGMAGKHHSEETARKISEAVSKALTGRRASEETKMKMKAAHLARRLRKERAAMKLEEIGFYTLNEERAAQASSTSPLWRCELILTGKCNFKCAYCRSVGGEDLPLEQAKDTVRLWASEGLKNIRFSGGEPTLYKGLNDLVVLAKMSGIERIALSTNGSAGMTLYRRLFESGVTDFSISLDACCAEDGDHMAGDRKGSFERVITSIRELSKLTYVTVGVVLTPYNVGKTEKIVEFADTLGVSDIRVIPAAQDGQHLPKLELSEEILSKYPILRYRAGNLASGNPVRGLNGGTGKCGLVLDDMAVMGDSHYPCIIYMREGGFPIGKVGKNMREERKAWYESHDSYEDKICSLQCLDVCVFYNNRYEEYHGTVSSSTEEAGKKKKVRLTIMENT